MKWSTLAPLPEAVTVVEVKKFTIIYNLRYFAVLKRRTIFAPGIIGLK
jgi:hypothetical protein